jgi:hypothetical protein
MERYKTLAERVDLSQLRAVERVCLEHANPTNLLLHLLGIVIIVYGLWTNVLGWVFIGVIPIILGHIYVTNEIKKQQKKKAKKK